MNDRATEFFEAACQKSLSARADLSFSIKDYVLAEMVVRIEYANEDIARQMGRAIAHLERSEAEKIDFTIMAWDSPENAMVAPAWAESAYGQLGKIAGFNDGRFRTAFDHGTGSLSMLDLMSRRAVFWTKDSTMLPAHERAAPFRGIFAWLLQAHKTPLIHAAAVSWNGMGVLLAGRGGAGKSTTALLCLDQAGCKYLADDYCALSPSNPPRIFSLYGTAKLESKWLGELRPEAALLNKAAMERSDEKKMLFLGENDSSAMVRSAPCRLLLLPRICDKIETTFEQGTMAEAVRALAPSSMFHTAVDGAQMFHDIAQFVRTVPIARLNLGCDPTRIASSIVRRLKEMNG